ncbi:bifunctional adenosylcobalamin biosynthesis protein CobU [Clostridium tepidiprofundi DSM 19306]|uniref:Adenosylcobinamide kinase n=1 Tax=Clostridium tepidiprofundi DSM 19306 TaxID=1121338 RepID=A0A151B5Z7_9CLOT|nr:bifunctional adenosylcobinamide kinase/adenosylcobinamide-phosphate guanylyltransferase [Clostridium tepidiprofundi]KYH35368.1 bifunctional adenosylcobalamin biosynthesis protein CobU [Clostridium tepidiprofundi DSM 19306]
MGKVTLITGGSRSGKSSYAESMLKGKDDVLYIATAIVTDKEMEYRIKRHRADRNQKWTTYEGYKDLDLAVENWNSKYVLLDCVTVMVTNLMFDEKRDFEKMSHNDIDVLLKHIKFQFKKFIDKCRDKDINLIMVTNEVGWGLVPEYKLSRIFRDIAGFVNQYIASLSDEVYIISCGLPLRLK